MATPLPSLPDVHRSILVSGNGLSRWLRFAGPGFLVAVGYMDPGNWATDLAAGSRFGYQLLWVVLASSLMAMLLQTMCVRLGVVAGRDLAQACREAYPKTVAIVLWLLCEVAIVATDVAEVVGSAVALQLLLGIPLVVGVLITAVDVLLLLALMRFGFRKLEALVLTLVVTIFACFWAKLWFAQPEWGEVFKGMFTPSMPSGGLLVSLGILGATVMPHNLYLHSAVVQTRDFGAGEAGKREALRVGTVDTIVSLGFAFFVNAAILILAAAVFQPLGREVSELAEAHRLLGPVLGGLSATLFAVALLCSGQSATITGTLAGQVVMEGFLQLRVRPWIRRAVTRGLAIVPAVILVTATGGGRTIDLLVLSQVVLSMQLPFAVFPLVSLTSDRGRMGALANPAWMRWTGYVVATGIAALNVQLLGDVLFGWSLLTQPWTYAVVLAVGLAWRLSRRRRLGC